MPFSTSGYKRRKEEYFLVLPEDNEKEFAQNIGRKRKRERERGIGRELAELEI